ncbi:MAG: tRNA pseudouridine(38-40) synthase TruA [Lentimicrobiaceae bacterium]|nr:tRNA pseudouridine(38-40) synthase TruA [Lentimicrobiaceae bacterium]
MRYFVELSYNGAPFFGWQRQPNQMSVQEVLEDCFSLLLKNKIELVGCGRTDTGVHARNFFAHFDYEELLAEDYLETLQHKLNAFLPKELVIYRIFKVADDAHARFSALDRTYKYYVAISKDPFQFQTTYRVYEKLDLEAMNAAASFLLENKDFTSFSKLHTDVNNNFCEIKAACWEQEGDSLVFTITANRFLRNMVRAIVGTLLLVGKGKISVTDFQEIIQEKNRNKAGMSAPAHALFLEKITYDFI